MYTATVPCRRVTDKLLLTIVTLRPLLPPHHINRALFSPRARITYRIHSDNSSSNSSSSSTTTTTTTAYSHE